MKTGQIVEFIVEKPEGAELIKADNLKYGRINRWYNHYYAGLVAALSDVCAKTPGKLVLQLGDAQYK